MTRFQAPRRGVVFICVLMLALSTVGCQKGEDAGADSAQASLVARPAAPSHADMVKRGEYLVHIAACHDCHTPKTDVATQALDEGLFLSGRPATTQAPGQPRPGEISAAPDLTAWWGPWGVSYAANLTPDPETGIGKRYTEASFIETIRTGKKPEGEPLLPPMPWPAYKHFNDEDLKAIYAYLSSLKPVKNFVRTAEPPA